MPNFTEYASALAAGLAKAGIRPYRNFDNTVIDESLASIALFRIKGAAIYSYILYNAGRFGAEAAVAEARHMAELAQRHLAVDGFRSVVMTHIFIGAEGGALDAYIDAAPAITGEQVYFLNYAVPLEGGKIVYKKDAPHELAGIIPLLEASFDGGQTQPSSAGELARKFGVSENAAKKADPILVYVTMLINIMVFALCEMNGGSENTDLLLMFGAMNGRLVASGQFYRLITAIFLHSGMAHIAMNCLSLYIFGTRIEKYYGRLHFFMIYLLSGIFASVVAGVIDPYAVMVGASGAICGLAGSALMLAYFKRKELDGLNQATLMMMIVASLSFGFLYPNVSNEAHFAGLFLGIIYGLFYFLAKRGERN